MMVSRQPRSAWATQATVAGYAILCQRGASKKKAERALTAVEQYQSTEETICDTFIVQF